MTAPVDREREALLTAAAAMLVDAADEARSVSMRAEEAHEALGEGAVLGALGALGDYDARLEALQAAVGAARTLLLRARDHGGSR